jgi:hypothetical protein
MHLPGRAVLGAFVLGLGTSAAAADVPPTWDGFSAVTLTFAEEKSNGTTWSGVFDDERRDFLLDVQLRDPEPMRGKVGLVGGRVMIVRGLKLAPGAEIDAMDGPVLSMRLAITVLARLFPDGPHTVLGLQRVTRDEDVGIQFATPSASGSIGAPWRVSGSVENYKTDVVNFDLRLTVPARTGAKGATGNIRLKGRLSKRTGPVFRDDMPLEGWSLYTLGRVTRPGGSATFGARPERADVKTIAELRRAIAQMR